MSQEAINTLTAVEERLKAQRAAAAAAEKEALTQAKLQGEQAIADAIAKAERENAALMQQTEDRAKAAAEEKLAVVARTKDELKAKTAARTEQAISLIVERIVNG